MKRHRDRGVTYLEVIVMVVVLVTGFSAVRQLADGVVLQNTEAREVAAATLIAQQRMEALKLQGYAALTDTGGIEGTDGPFDANGEPSPTGRYTVRWDIQDNVPIPAVKRIRVEVSWTAHNRHLRTVALDTGLSHVLP